MGYENSRIALSSDPAFNNHNYILPGKDYPIVVNFFCLKQSCVLVFLEEWVIIKVLGLQVVIIPVGFPMHSGFSNFVFWVLVFRLSGFKYSGVPVSRVPPFLLSVLLESSQIIPSLPVCNQFFSLLIQNFEVS